MSTGVLGKPLNAEEMKKLCVLTPRVAKRRKIWEEEPASVCPEGSLLFTKSWKETEGLPVDVRWARALEKKLLEGPIEIFEDELIVGSLTKRVKGVELMTAFRPFEIQKMLQDGRFSRQMSDNTSAIIDEEDMKLLREEADYWTTHLPPDYVNDAIRAELGEEHFELMNDASGLLEGPYLRKYAERSLFCDVGSWGGVLALHKDVLDAGLNDVLKTAYEELAKMTAEKIDYVTDTDDAPSWHSGSAVAISDSILVTNSHVIDGVADFRLWRDGERVNTPLGFDIISGTNDGALDLAIIKVRDGGLRSCAISGTAPVLGETVHVWGYPNTRYQGIDIKVTRGIVSGKRGFMGDERMFQIDAAVQPGNSGGPVVQNGKIIGIATAFLIDSDNVAFAINAENIRGMLNKYGVVPKPTTNNFEECTYMIHGNDDPGDESHDNVHGSRKH